MNTRARTLIVVLVLTGTGLGRASTFNVTLQELDGNVVATGSGSIDLTDLGYLGPAPEGGLVDPVDGSIVIGSVDGAPTDFYIGSIDGSSSFGSGSAVAPSSNGGDTVGVYEQEIIIVPQGYVSGDSLSGTMTFEDATLSSLGITPGEYTWSWGSDADAGTFTLDAVPEPSQYGFGIFFALAGLVAWRRFSIRVA